METGWEIKIASRSPGVSADCGGLVLLGVVQQPPVQSRTSGRHGAIAFLQHCPGADKPQLWDVQLHFMVPSSLGNPELPGQGTSLEWFALEPALLSSELSPDELGWALLFPYPGNNDSLFNTGFSQTFYLFQWKNHWCYISQKSWGLRKSGPSQTSWWPKSSNDLLKVICCLNVWFLFQFNN